MFGAVADLDVGESLKVGIETDLEAMKGVQVKLLIGVAVKGFGTKEGLDDVEGKVRERADLDTLRMV